MTMYHRESYQEGFLVLRGECLLIVEGQEVPLAQWDYFHCPVDVPHSIVGWARARRLYSPSAAGSDRTSILYPRDEIALTHHAGVEQDTPHPKEAYARFTRPAPDVPYRDEFLRVGGERGLMSGYAIAHLDEIEEINDGRCPWRPVRHHFGITSFGVNTWTARAAGDRIINEHDEAATERGALPRRCGGAPCSSSTASGWTRPSGPLVFARPA